MTYQYLLPRDCAVLLLCALGAIAGAVAVFSYAVVAW